ncbi:flagellar basal body P-ring protein FlgI [Gilliamella sp. Pra-s65]|uniref:flagellar basal body P-ring protein FlgI n=1 Tax=unclassified Gilliamella TaxID=2685620 RepID=UPI0013217295|nr:MULTISPECIES: flagellar basal body P-ring protein FlgI [unclassified Gilliamella]MWN31936.1 flagellar basal body P-ring protein FlgI [Gilliamella sp. Pra-s60]MWN90089.1 flagellar basal body P-ring protein FlgI [Gilliamella sp. Pra-s65]MWP29142.1 flagellar basal body P-ring protein FlgI [Gilliamella sp. Pra-s54]MWP73228.1 flagellar basal body P-ring protein FlgI [Gilliamella sp. Pra-s52]
MIKKLRSFFSVIFMMILVIPNGHAERIRDLVTIQGVRENALVGYGIVVGLDGTGDQTSQTPFTIQSITNMLSQLGITVPSGSNMQLKNVAAVMVTAKLPSYSRVGQKIDVVVSSLGNAKSLRGGTLIMTPLKGADNQVYAIAQGNLFVGGMGASNKGSSVSINQMAGASIPNGATIERELEINLNEQNIIHLHLNEFDFTRALKISDAINRLQKNIAVALDGTTIALQMPEENTAKVKLLSQIQNLEIAATPISAKVVINTRTGVVVMNQKVRLDNCAVAHGNLSVVINRKLNVSQPNTPLAGGATVVTPENQISVEQEGGALHNLASGADLNHVINSLNVLGANPTELMSILEALKTAGCLHAALETI